MASVSSGRPKIAMTDARRTMLLLMAFLVSAWSAPSPSQQTDPDAGALERRVKAAFLYKFAGYVTWPEGAFPRPDMPVTIAVMGADTLASELEQLVAGHTVNDRKIAVKRLRFW